MAQDLGLPAETTALLSRFGFESIPFDALRARVRTHATDAAQNRVTGVITPPVAAEIPALPAPGTPARAELARIGSAAIARGEVAAVVLAGGMATRFGGVVKALVDALPGQTFLDLKLRDVAHAAKTAGGTIPAYFMTSVATDGDMRTATAGRGTDAVPVATFPQYASLRLTADGDVFREEDGSPSVYAPGHGDLTFALRSSGILRDFRAHGGKYLMMTNVDNLVATLDPAVIGAHIQGGKAITVEVVEKEPGDAGGAPAKVDGVLQIVETFRFPEEFDQTTIPVFNTNTLIFNADAIDRDFELTWFVVKKKVDGRDVIQFERLVGELTAFLPTAFLLVPRHGDDARFQPAKDPAELERRRPEIRAVLTARGVL